MFIIDKQIKEMCEQRKLIAENYNSDNVGSVSYDLTVEYIRTYAVSYTHKRNNS